jgi:16S rRNA processing protein RimM
VRCAAGSMEETWGLVGPLGHTRGRQGEIKAEIYSSQPGRAERLHEVKLQKGALTRLALIESVWHHGGVPVLKFAGIDCISDAEPWEHSEILVRSAELAQPEEGEFLHTDLIGCVVWDEDEDQPLGSVRGVQEFGSAPLLQVDAGGREVLIPLARSICREIDVARKIIRAKLPEGLTEL